MKHPFIICGFPGIGKTTAAQKHRNAEDIESSIFSWVWKDGNRMERNKDFPKNYIDFVEKYIEENYSCDYVFLSSHQKVREELKKRNINYIIITPNLELRNEYLIRYFQRGSDVEFIKDMYDNWYSYIHGFEKDEVPIIRLDKGEWLSSIIS